MTLALLGLLALIVAIPWAFVDYLRTKKDNSDRAWRKWCRRNGYIDVRKMGRYSNAEIDGFSRRTL